MLKPSYTDMCFLIYNYIRIKNLWRDLFKERKGKGNTLENVTRKHNLDPNTTYEYISTPYQKNYSKLKDTKAHFTQSRNSSLKLNH